MIDYHLDLYPASDPKDGARVTRFTKLQDADYRDVVGVGSWQAVIRSTEAQAALIDATGEQYVRVVRDNAGSEAVVGGGFVSRMAHDAAVAQETDRLTFGGPGTLAYVARAVMAPRTYLGELIPGFTAMDPFDGIWRLHAQGLGNTGGAIAWRVLTEAGLVPSGDYTHRHKDGTVHTGTHAEDRSANAIPALTLGFDADVDSDGNPWSLTFGEFTAQIGENVLNVLHRLMQGGMYFRMDPDTFVLDAWEGEEHRRDRTGGALGASVVRLQAPTDGTRATGTYKSDVSRVVNSHIRRSALWVGGGDDLYVKASGPSPIPWEGFIPSDINDATALASMAATQVTAREEASDVGSVRIKLGADPANGYYLPFEDVRVDDLVTVHTGAGDWDYTEATYPVHAVRLKLREAGDWDAFVELGGSFESAQQRSFDVATTAAHPHPPNPQLCQPGVISTFAPVASLGANSNASGTNHDAGVVAGPRVERVQLTLTRGIVAGQTIIVLASHTLGTEPATGVWDDAGNAYSEAAYYRRPPGGAQPRTFIFSAVVTAPLSIGDTITFEVDVGSSLNASIETGERTISAYLFDGAVSSPVESGNADAISSAPAVTVGAGDLIVAAVAMKAPASDTIGGDVDWTAFDSAGGNGGSEANRIMGGFRVGDADGETFTGSINQARDWAAVGAIFSTSSATTVYDGHPDLVGIDPRVTRCDHRHDVHRDRAPLATDDWASAGYKLGTIWAQLDDLVTPTAIVGTWMLVDVTAGAVWLEVGAGVTDHGELTGLADDDHPQYVLHTELETAGHWEPVTNGDVTTPEIVFDQGDVVMEWTS